MLAMVLRTAVRSLGSTGGVSGPSCERVVRLGEEWEDYLLDSIVQRRKILRQNIPSTSDLVKSIEKQGDLI